MDKSLIIKEIKKYYNIKSDADLARHIGISTQNMYTWIKRNTYDAAAILAKCPELSAEWLLTGNGKMLKEDIHKAVEILPSIDIISELKEAHKEIIKTKDAMINLQEKMLSAKEETIAAKDDTIKSLKAQLMEKDKRVGLDHAQREDATCAAVK